MADVTLVDVARQLGPGSGVLNQEFAIPRQNALRMLAPGKQLSSFLLSRQAPQSESESRGSHGSQTAAMAGRARRHLCCGQSQSNERGARRHRQNQSVTAEIEQQTAAKHTVAVSVWTYVLETVYTRVRAERHAQSMQCTEPRDLTAATFAGDQETLRAIAGPQVSIKPTRPAQHCKPMPTVKIYDKYIQFSTQTDCGDPVSTWSGPPWGCHAARTGKSKASR